MHGISEARYIPAVLARIAEYHKDATRFLATGINMSGPYAGLALSGPRRVYIPNCWAGNIVFRYLDFWIMYAVLLLISQRHVDPVA